MPTRLNHFSALGILPRTLATAAIWSIAIVMAVRLRHPLAGIALGAMAVCFTIVVWVTRGRLEQERHVV